MWSSFRCAHEANTNNSTAQLHTTQTHVSLVTQVHTPFVHYTGTVGDELEPPIRFMVQKTNNSSKTMDSTLLLHPRLYYKCKHCGKVFVLKYCHNSNCNKYHIHEIYDLDKQRHVCKCSFSPCDSGGAAHFTLLNEQEVQEFLVFANL